MNECSKRLLRAIEELVVSVQEISRMEQSVEVYESEEDKHFDQIDILSAALKKIASSSAKTIGACKKIAEEAIEESRGVIL